MKTIIIAGVLVAILAIGGGIYYVTLQKDDGSPATTTEVATGEHAEVGETKESCELLTAEIAKTVLGEGAAKAELPAGAQVSNNDVSVTNCLYEAGSGAQIATVNMLARGAKTAAGQESNRFGFEGIQDRSNFEGTGMEHGPTQPISGLGDAAFFDPDFEQVNVLVEDGNYWLIIQGETRAQSEQIARLVLENI